MIYDIPSLRETMDEEFAREIGRHAVLRSCVALGVKSTKIDCLDVVHDVVRHFVQTVAVRARDSAEASGRSYGGVQDILPTLESMGPFDVSWKTLKDFGLEVDESKVSEQTGKWDQPFPFEVPAFPIEKHYTPFGLNELDNSREKNKHDSDSFIPSHLPAYPSSHTYQSQLGKKRRADDSFSTETAEQQQKRPKPVLNTKHARESLMKLENLPTVGES